MLCADAVPAPLRFLPGAEQVVTALDPDDRFDATVACDTGHPSRLPAALPPPERRGIFINLDHHASTPRFGDLNLIDIRAAAVGVLVYRLLKAMGLPLGPEAAAALYVSLLSDTGGFRHGNTDVEALRVAADLVEAGARAGELASAIWQQDSLEQMKLLGKVLQTLQLTHGGRVGWVTLTNAAVHEAGTAQEPADGFVTFPRSIAGVQVAVLLREQSKQWRVSLRSRGQVDVARIAGLFGGGGHAAAAGCCLVGDGDMVRRRLTAALSAALERT